MRSPYQSLMEKVIATPQKASNAKLLKQTFQGIAMTALTLNLDSITHLTHEQFRELCRENRDIRLELTAKGELIVMPPTGWESGNRNIKLAARLQIWTEANNGFAFDSSTGFILPNGATRSASATKVVRPTQHGLQPKESPHSIRTLMDSCP